MTEKASIIELSLHAPIGAITDKSPVEFSTECMAGLNLCWYKINRSANSVDLPSVQLNSVGGSLLVPKVTSVTIVIDDRVGESVENIAVTLRGLPDNSTHKQNMGFLSALIINIKSAGWKHYYFPSDPRISGSQASKVELPNQVLGKHVSSHPWLDPDYFPDADRWMKIRPFYNWYFYNGGEHLHLKAWRNDSKTHPAESGTYLISLEFKTEREYWVSGFTGSSDRARWKALLTENLKTYQETRLLTEEKARAAGIEIDESYQDPPIKALTQ